MRPHVAGVKVHDGGPVGILGVSVVVHKYDDHYVVANVPLAFQLQKIRVVKRVCISIILSPVLVKRVKGQLNKIGKGSITWKQGLQNRQKGTYRNRINFRHGLIFVNFGHTKNTEFIPHMRMQFHKKLYCKG